MTPGSLFLNLHTITGSTDTSATRGVLLQEYAITSSNKDAVKNSTTLYKNIKVILRNSKINRTRQPVALSEDFVALPESPSSFDRTPSIQIAEDEVIPSLIISRI